MQLTGDLRQTFDRRVADRIYPQPLVFDGELEGALLAGPVAQRGATRYWQTDDAAVALCIARVLGYGFRDVSAAASFATEGIDDLMSGQAHERQLRLWVHKRARSGAAPPRRPVTERVLALTDGAGLVQRVAAPIGTLAGMSDADLGAPPDETVDLADVLASVRKATVARNLDAIRRDPRLLRENYTGWRAYTDERPDRR